MCINLINSNQEMNPLIKSSVVYVVASAMGQGMSFLGVIFFTRLMSKEDYGNYSTYYAYVSMLTVIIGANLYYALNNAYIDIKHDIKKFRKTVLYLSTIIAVIVALTIWIIGVGKLGKFSTFEVVMAVLHAYAFFVINYRIYSANMENDVNCKKWLLILPNTLQFFMALVFVLCLPVMSYVARIVGSVIGVGGIALITYVNMLKVRGDIINLRYWKYALTIAVPSIVMSVSYMIMQQCDKVMITNICGADETAVYSVIYYLGYAMLAINQAIAPVRQAWIYRKLDSGDCRDTKYMQKWYLVIFAGFVTFVLMFGEVVVKIIVPQIYWQFEYIVPFVLSACMMLLYGFYTEVILFYKKNMILSLTVLIAAVVNIGLNAVYIPRVGAVAACYTTAGSYFLLFVMAAVIAEKNVKGIYILGYFMAFIGWSAVMAAIYILTEKQILIRYLLYLLAIAVLIVYYIKNREELAKLIKG